MPFGKISRMPQSRLRGRGVMSRPAPMPAPSSMEYGYAKGGKIASKKKEMEMPKKYAGGGTVSRGAGAAQRGYDYKVYAKGGSIKKYEEGGEVDREPRRAAFASEMLPTRPQRKPSPKKKLPDTEKKLSDTEKMKGIVEDMQREERYRKAEMPSDLYAKGGSVCRGMGSATKGGKYSIK